MVFKTLRRRLVVLGLIPVAILLILVGVIGFFYIRRSLLEEWQEASLLKLERASHYILMRINRPLQVIDMLKESTDRPGGHAIRNWIIERLSSLDGVTEVKIDLGSPEMPGQPLEGTSPPRMMMRMMPFHRVEIASVSVPHYANGEKDNTVSLVFALKDKGGSLVGNLRLAMSLNYLLQDVRALGWWQSEMACLVDQEGFYLAHTGAMAAHMTGRSRLGGTADPLELRLVEAQKNKEKGTVLSSGHPPDLVAGFYRIKGTPWTIIMYAPGEAVLSSILEFRNYYVIAVAVCIALIILLIRSVEGRVVTSVEKITKAAQLVAGGDYKHLGIKNGRDEIGVLVQSFNAMVDGLKERDDIRDTFGRYMDPEIAKNIMRHPRSISLGGEKRSVAILMSDIRGFTDLSETLGPEDIIHLLNEYFSHVLEPILDHGGIIVDFLGDGILVFFDPLDGPIEEAAKRAVSCARSMLDAVREFNENTSRVSGVQFPTAIGINVGPVVVGNIGSSSRTKYGIVGSAVNVTHRIQSYAQGDEIIVSESTVKAAGLEAEVHSSCQTELKGIKEPVTLHRLK